MRSFGYMMIALCAGAATVSADLIRYKLNDHPDGTAQPPGYGLRLDELVDITPRAKDIFTFSFNPKYGSNMSLDYDTEAGTMHIYGTAYGGLDIGTGYSPNGELAGMWSIDFTYTDVRGHETDDDLVAGGNGPGSQGFPNEGSITPLFRSSVYDDSYQLIGYPPTYPWTFRFGDGDFDSDGNGLDDFRGWDAEDDGFGISGWGWLNHSGAPGIRNHQESSDWIFTAQPDPIPAPGSIVLGVLGLAGIWSRRAARRTRD